MQYNTLQAQTAFTDFIIFTILHILIGYYFLKLCLLFLLFWLSLATINIFKTIFEDICIRYAKQQTLFVNKYVFRDRNARLGGDHRANCDVAGLSKLPDGYVQLTANLCWTEFFHVVWTYTALRRTTASAILLELNHQKPSKLVRLAWADYR